ncbi:MAG: late competence development ComFB family protein [Candidatus Methylomirabilia bacterium]
MKLSNSMEPAVRLHLSRLRAQSPQGDETCWCPLCRADMMALALTSLPPRYATCRPCDVAVEPRTAAAIHDEVVIARLQIERLPKHAKGAPVAEGEPVWVVNFPLEEGFRAVDAILRRDDTTCDCWNCRCDMVAFALNRFPARYGVEYQGRTHLIEEHRERMRDELTMFLDHAVRVVTTVPRHDLRTA